MKLLTSTHSSSIDFRLDCYDRLLFVGTLPTISHEKAMTSLLFNEGVKIFDYPKYAEQFRDKIRDHMEKIIKDLGQKNHFIRKNHIRKEDYAKEIFEENPDYQVVVLSAMEQCSSYRPQRTSEGKYKVVSSTSKCLHYYVYVQDEVLGLCHIRIPTWLPLRMQVCCNGHHVLAMQLDKKGINYRMLDNSFEYISDIKTAQELAKNIDIKQIHQRLDTLVGTYCPVYKEFKARYHWSISQAEFATDIVFKEQSTLGKLYEELVATAIHTVKPDNVLTFLGKKLDPKYQQEVSNKYNVRIEGSRIKHTAGKQSIKMYDKFSKILRIETTTSHVSFFKTYREVVHRDGTKSNKYAPLKKNIYSLADLQYNLLAANNRYLDFISAFDNKQIGRDRLNKVTQSKKVNNRNYKGFDFFKQEDIELILTILRGEFNIKGFRNKDLRKILGWTSAKVSRLIKRLRVHGLVKKAARGYNYYVQKLGKEVVITAQKIKELLLVPAMNY